MKTLVIHPKDPTTKFLKPIYKNIPNKTVIRGGATREELREAIKTHDRVMMMGHGSPSGLFSVRQFPFFGFVIDHTFVDLLSEKTDNVFIWCNADQFVLKHELKGFFTGMFISEVHEAFYCNVSPVKEKDVIKSNNKFAKLLGEGFAKHDKLHKIYNNLKQEYGVLIKKNNIADYNCKRLYLEN